MDISIDWKTHICIVIIDDGLLLLCCINLKIIKFIDSSSYYKFVCSEIWSKNNNLRHCYTMLFAKRIQICSRPITLCTFIFILFFMQTQSYFAYAV